MDDVNASSQSRGCSVPNPAVRFSSERKMIVSYSLFNTDEDYFPGVKESVFPFIKNKFFFGFIADYVFVMKADGRLIHSDLNLPTLSVDSTDSEKQIAIQVMISSLMGE